MRAACSYIKRQSEEIKWKDRVSHRILKMIKDVTEKVEREDPVRGKCHIPKVDDDFVWRDASSISMGVVLELVDVKVWNCLIEEGNEF